LTCDFARMSVVMLGHGVSPLQLWDRSRPSVPRASPGDDVFGQGLVHPGDPYAVEAMGAARVDAAEYLDAVPGPDGDLGVGDAGVEPAGDTRVAQVVGAFHQRRGELFGVRDAARTFARPAPR
jgi:hypothetical protein